MKKPASLPDQSPKPPRLLWVEFIRVVGAFLVVLAHVTHWGGNPQWGHTLYYTISRNGVVLFFMISGFLVLSRQEDTWDFLKKRAWKILIPLFIWSAIYDIYWNNALIDTGINPQSIFRLFLRILRGPRAGHLWFFYAIIGLYLFAPVLRLFIAKARNSDLMYYIGLWFLAVPVLFILQGITPLQSGFELYYATGYVGYYLIGLYLGRSKIARSIFIPMLVMLIAGYTFTFLVFHLDLPPRDYEPAFRSYLSLNVAIMAISAFFLLKAAGEAIPNSTSKFFSVVGKSSFGIYLIHPLIEKWLATGLESIGMRIESGPSIFIIPLVALVVFLISFFIIHILQRIPIIKTFVP